MKAELRKLVGIFSARGRENETCAACGEKFVCGATLAGCWCREVKLSDTARAELQQRYKGCLCRACLEKFAAESWSHGKEARPKEEMPG